MSWSEGRYQTRQFFPDETTATDLTGAAAPIADMPVMFPKVELRTLEAFHDAASAGVTTAAVIELQRLNVNPIWDTLVGPGTVGTTDVLGTLTVDDAAAQYGISDLNLDPNADDIHTPAAFPVAYRGDVLTINHTVQGDGTQSARVQFKYRELENRADEIDGPTA